MPPASSKSSISPGELAICEDFLDGHREYAIDLLSNLENICQWHKTAGCTETREGRTCTLCELCSADGLTSAATTALAAYDDAEKRLTTIRSSLGKDVPSRGASCRETLFRNSLAKAVFLSIVTAGDTLRSQHATWQRILQSEVLTSSFAQSPQHANTGCDDLDKNKIGDAMLPTYSGPRVVRPESTSSSSTFVVIRQCLASDCPCEATRANVKSNTNLRGASGSQIASKVPPSPTNPKKRRASKVTAKSEVGGNHTPRSTTTDLECRPRKTGDTSDALAKAKTNTQTQKPSVYHNPNNPDVRARDMPRPEDAVLEEHAPSSPASETESYSPSTECGGLIVDPRVFRLRTQIARSDDARRALMEWCRVCMANLHLDAREAHKTGLETHGLAMKGTRGYHSLEAVEPEKSPCTTSRVGTATKGQSHGDDSTTAQELRLNGQEELEAKWLIARRERCKDRKRLLSRIDPC